MRITSFAIVASRSTDFPVSLAEISVRSCVPSKVGYRSRTRAQAKAHSKSCHSSKRRPLTSCCDPSSSLHNRRNALLEQMVRSSVFLLPSTGQQLSRDTRCVCRRKDPTGLRKLGTCSRLTGLPRFHPGEGTSLECQDAPSFETRRRSTC